MGWYDIEHMFDQVDTQLPSSFATMAPGLMLAMILESVADAELSDSDRILVLQAHERMASYYQGLMYTDMVDVAGRLEAAGDDPMEAAEAAAAEVRVALRLTRRHADSEMAYALQLDGELAALGAAVREGRLDVRRAKVIADATLGLSQAGREWVLGRILDDAPRLTTGQLRARVVRLALEADPEAARLQHEAQVDQRRVVIEPTGPGTADIIGIGLPADRVAGAKRRIEEMARSLRRAGESRTMDQLRADVFLDLLEGDQVTGSHAGRRGVVDLTVDLATLAGLSEAAGELAGYGPVFADIARQVADRQRDSQWRFTVTDPETARPIQTGITRRRPTTSDRRDVEARDRTCIFPGCRMSAADCDLDHRLEHVNGGPPTPDNLVPLCRHDHRIRHTHGWKHRRVDHGDHEWTTRLGQVVTTSGAPP
jgi:hypothetical protein